MAHATGKQYPSAGFRQIRPWLFLVEGELICEMHPSLDGPGPLWVHKTRTRRSLARWIRDHKRCGFSKR